MRRMWIFAALAALLLSGYGAKTQASEPWEAVSYTHLFCYHFSTYKIEKPEGFDREDVYKRQGIYSGYLASPARWGCWHG